MGETTEAAAAVDAVLRDADKIDWADALSANEIAGGMFDSLLAEGGPLVPHLRAVIAARGAGSDCESYPEMDKLVLWHSADKSLRLRLHIFHPGYDDRPHNHRWTFVSRVLTGGYVHSLYGSEDAIAEQTSVGGAPRPKFSRIELPGTQFFLDHSLVHSLSADRVSVSLLLRGPSVKDDYFTWDAAAGRMVFSRGAARESAAERVAKTMPAERFDHVLTTLRAEGVL